jgi:hypothetical protein
MSSSDEWEVLYGGGIMKKIFVVFLGEEEGLEGTDPEHGSCSASLEVLVVGGVPDAHEHHTMGSDLCVDKGPVGPVLKSPYGGHGGDAGVDDHPEHENAPGVSEVWDFKEYVEGPSGAGGGEDNVHVNPSGLCLVDVVEGL